MIYTCVLVKYLYVHVHVEMCIACQINCEKMRSVLIKLVSSVEYLVLNLQSNKTKDIRGAVVVVIIW